VPPEALVALATVFALITGANDGGALIAPGLRVPAMPVGAGLGVLVLCVTAVPALVSTAVAVTLLEGFVPAGSNGLDALTVGFVVSVLVVSVLARAGRPTSLTLAVVGGITGAGVGFGLQVEWMTLVRVLAIGLAAPVVGAVIAYAASYLWRAGRDARYLATVQRGHVVAYVTQCLAYGANDGQKLLVLFLAASVTAGHGATLAWWMYLIMAAAFAVGALLGLPRVARTVSAGILSGRPTHIVTAEDFWAPARMTACGGCAGGWCEILLPPGQ
jgi:PiT family inorganic phosphate transporter